MKSAVNNKESVVKVVSRKRLNRLARASKSQKNASRQIKLNRRSESVERVITILQPDMYLKPHRHGQRATEGYEFITVLKGKLGVLLFYQEGGIVQILRSGTSGPLRSVEIPNGVYHSLVALSPNTTLLEVSTGKTEKSTRVLTNFPEPLSPEAETLLKRWHNYFRTPVNPKIRR